MLGCENQFQFAHNGVRAFWSRLLIQGGFLMRTEIVLNQGDFLVRRIQLFHNVGHFLDPIPRGMPRADMHFPASLQGCDEHIQIGGSLTTVFIIHMFNPRAIREGRATFSNQLLGVIRALLDIQHFFPRTHKFSTGFGDQPTFHAPGLEFVFLITVAHFHD